MNVRVPKRRSEQIRDRSQRWNTGYRWGEVRKVTPVRLPDSQDRRSHPRRPEVAAFLPALLRALPGVRSCTLLELPLPDSIGQSSSMGEELLDLSRRARQSCLPGESFHERLMDMALAEGRAGLVLDSAMAHQPLDRAVSRNVICREDLSESTFREVLAGAGAGNLVVLLSSLETDAGERHLPMLDYGMTADEQNHATAREIARRMGPGALVQSGASYHYYGRELLTRSQLRQWLLRAQLLNRYVDARWITHQLLEGCCALRVGTSGRGHGYAPFVLSDLD